MSGKIKLIVGLGNPGSKYSRTRHNTGAAFVDVLAKQHQLTLRVEAKFFGAVGKITELEHSSWLLKPLHYMNNSGLSVSVFSDFYKISPESILIVHDELDFSVGIVRIKAGGGHGGHNGVKDVIRQLRSQNFFRLRIGIGHPGTRNHVTPYVLGRPSPSDQNKISKAIYQGIIVVPALIEGDLQEAFHSLHSAI